MVNNEGGCSDFERLSGANFELRRVLHLLRTGPWYFGNTCFHACYELPGRGRRSSFFLPFFFWFDTDSSVGVATVPSVGEITQYGWNVLMSESPPPPPESIRFRPTVRRAGYTFRVLLSSGCLGEGEEVLKRL